jgi:hypothetical protein
VPLGGLNVKCELQSEQKLLLKHFASAAEESEKGRAPRNLTMIDVSS